ncbi:hypothetical protein QVD17_19070 [Tagetes erecta]|uniref:Citrate transporter-like domain-containing protein n=1 Tax=Tagetes erecta TaxID=13708 RepID=A0AAD8KP05_TARER|nr:hypothetical protein QVD17_19070 [Tagetes erecta]
MLSAMPQNCILSLPQFHLDQLSRSIYIAASSPKRSMSNPPPPETNNATVMAIPTHSRRRCSVKFPDFAGAKPIPLAISVSVGLVVWFAIPIPVGITHEAWQLLAIFLATVTGLILGPLPVGAWAFVCLTISVLTRTLPFEKAFAAFTNEIIWLIVISFFFSRGFVKTGLGDRLAMYFVRWLGRSTLGLAYGLALSEAIISPAMPSATARAGGIFLPVIKSLAIAGDSRPNDPSARKLGAYLIQSQFQIYPPETKYTRDAPILAKNKLHEMGPVKRNEWIMLGTMLITVALWIFGETIHISSVVAAMLGLSVLFLLGALTWDDCLSEKSAWDTLAWFAVLIGMATQLTTLGIVPWMSKSVANFLKYLSVGWPVRLMILQFVYFFLHYIIAGQTAHVGALYSAFLSMHLTSKVPEVLSAMLLSYNTCLFSAITHYSSGQAAVYYGAGYVKLPDLFKLGIMMAIINITIWVLIGSLWWKILGFY